MNIFNFTIHYKKGSEMPADFLSRNVCEAINVFDSKLPQLQEEDKVCTIIRDFIHNLDNPTANQKPFKSKQANANLIKYAQECFIQDDILWIRRNKMEGTPRTCLFVPEVLKELLVKEAHGQLNWSRRHLKNKGKAQGIVLLAEHGCGHCRTHQSLPKMPKEEG